MSRSVSVPSDAVNVCFAHVEEEEYWDEVVESYRNAIEVAFPSCVKAGTHDRWIGREDRVIASNHWCDFGISECGGLVSLWMLPRGGDYRSTEGLRDKWIEYAGPKFALVVEQCFGNRLVRVATFSNGEACFRRAP